MKNITTKTLTCTNWKLFKKKYDFNIKTNIKCIAFGKIKHFRDKDTNIWSVKFQEDLNI
jgi:hypothetical protein